ncbi:phospholipase effector Tle1 domain-containing protein [Rhodophyticola sp. CCM32]|uniref:phospholipase effector Tle1 domain-containing protein n=1 Tax=Rhodophyticola sp. CCM32 TaxID=2916397 RepID=UPI00236857EF|nr:DUF2235 domain-containing protein [Rhodophyticola sp. CCM32]
MRALGLRWPVIWRIMGKPHPYHSDALGPSTRVARHALALDETRDVYAPVLWTAGPEQEPGQVQQMWFRGAHGDIGGQLGGRLRARPLANIPLVWMLAEAESCGLPLPQHWRMRYITDASAPEPGRCRAGASCFWRAIAGWSDRMHQSRFTPRPGGREQADGWWSSARRPPFGSSPCAALPRGFCAVGVRLQNPALKAFSSRKTAGKT